MNARQHFAKADNSDPPELRQAHWTLAEERFTTDVDHFAEWLTECSGDREPCDFFNGPISTPELVRLGLSGMCNPARAKAVLDELRKRYLADQPVEETAWSFHI